MGDVLRHASFRTRKRTNAQRPLRSFTNHLLDGELSSRWIHLVVQSPTNHFQTNRMWKSNISGFSICVSVYIVMFLLCVTGTTYAKRGCSAFGHSCFGGHGKRFDSHLRDITFQRNEVPTSDNTQETEDIRLNNQVEVPKQKFRGQEEILLQTRRQPPLRFDSYTLSSIVRQWLASQHRLHQPEMEIDK